MSVNENSIRWALSGSRRFRRTGEGLQKFPELPEELSARTRRKQTGFTLLEAVLVLAIVGLTALVALPMLHRTKVKSGSNQALRAVNSLLDQARAEALKRHSPVAIIISTSDRTFQVFEDWDPANAEVATNGNGKLDGAELVTDSLTLDGALRYAHPSGGPVIEFAVNSDSDRYLAYRADGSLMTVGGSLQYADSWNNFFRVRVNASTGAARTEKWLGGTKWTPRREQWVWKY